MLEVKEESMILFLTSSPCTNDMPEGVELPCILNEDNGFVEQLKKHWKPEVVFINWYLTRNCLHKSNWIQY